MNFRVKLNIAFSAINFVMYIFHQEIMSLIIGFLCGIVAIICYKKEEE